MTALLLTIVPFIGPVNLKRWTRWASGTSVGSGTICENVRPIPSKLRLSSDSCLLFRVRLTLLLCTLKIEYSNEHKLPSLSHLFPGRMKAFPSVVNISFHGSPINHDIHPNITHWIHRHGRCGLLVHQLKHTCGGIAVLTMIYNDCIEKIQTYH